MPMPHPTLRPDQIRWPFCAIDFEASGLDRTSHPVEIGICSWDGPGRPARVWSSLIRRSPEWVRGGSWDPASERIHGLTPEQLADAPVPSDVLRAANLVLPIGSVAHCDGGDHDLHWMRSLEAAAGFPATFVLGSIERISHHMDDSQAWHLLINPRKVVHRAGPDALQHVTCLANAFGIYDLKVETLPTGV